MTHKKYIQSKKTNTVWRWVLKCKVAAGVGMLLPPIVVVSCQDKFCQLFERFNKSLFQATLFDKMKKKHKKCMMIIIIINVPMFPSLIHKAECWIRNDGSMKYRVMVLFTVYLRTESSYHLSHLLNWFKLALGRVTLDNI